MAVSIGFTVKKEVGFFFIYIYLYKEIIFSLPHTTLMLLSLCLGSQIEFGIVYSCIEDKMYTARKGKGAFCNGVPIKVSGQEGTRTSHFSLMMQFDEETTRWSQTPSHYLILFSDITKSLVLTETGFKSNPEHFKTMTANITAILSIPVHGYI